MNTSTNVNNITFGKNLLVASLIGTASMVLPFEHEISYYEPTQVVRYKNIEDNELLNHDYFISNNSISENDKIDIIIEFAGNLVNVQKNIEQEYVDFVNDNFWDLI
jgi:hypothetical protein